MKTIFASLLLILLPHYVRSQVSDSIPNDSTLKDWYEGYYMSQKSAPLADSLYRFSKLNPIEKPRPWRAAVQTALTNVGVWGFDRFIMNEEFAHINIHTIRHNIKNGFVWDNDQFSTNLFAHPYHGGLYFNTARANGMNFWQSIPYSFCGSLMWEIAAEREPPALNDLIATTCGGVALGEVTNRLSALVLDESKGGTERVAREIVGFILSPMRGINRLISGETWRRHTSYSVYHDQAIHPVHFSLGLGGRYLADHGHLFQGESSPFVNFNLLYGTPFNEETSKPYDYFTCNMIFNMASNQPLISRINLKGCLWKKRYELEGNMNLVFGFFQHFNYYDSEPVIDGTNSIPFKISEAASFGPGIIYRFPMTNNLVKLEQHLYASLVLLGGSLSDYYSVIDRNYNMGSGYSLKSQTSLDFGRFGSFIFKMSQIQLFTWKGYSTTDLLQKNPLYLNAQGDKGSSQLFIIEPNIKFKITNNLALAISSSYYLRHTHYKQYKDKTFQTFESRLGLYLQF